MSVRKLTIVMTFAALLMSQAAVAQSKATIVNRWLFNEAGGFVALNSASTSAYGMLQGEAQFVDDPVMGRAASFFGPTGAFVVPADASQQVATGTLQVFVNPDKAQNSDVIEKANGGWVRSNVGYGGSVYLLRITSFGQAYGCVGNDDPATGGFWTCAYSRARQVKPGEWTLLSLTWDGSMVTLYVNGNPEGSQSYNPIPGLGLSYTSTDGPLTASVAYAWADNEPHEFTGKMADIRLYQGARVSSEMRADYLKTVKGVR